MNQPTPPPPSAVTRTLARNRLGWRTLAGFVLAAAAPLTVVGGGVSTAWATTGLASIPISYLVVVVLLSLFAAGYTAMAGKLPHAGAFYAYLTAGLGRPAGVAGGFVAICAYCAMQVGLYGGLGVVGAGVLSSVFGLTVPWWVCSVIGWAATAVCGVLKVNLNGAILGVALGIECAVILVFDVIMIAHPHHGHVSAAALNPATLLSGGVLGLVAITIAVTSAVGIEDGPNYAEESPRGAPVRAVFASLVVAGVLYAGSAWAMTVAAGPGNVVAGSREYATEYLFTLVGPHVPQVMLDLGHVLFLTSLFAAGLSFHNTFNRYVFSLARDRVLPHGLSRTWRRTQSPARASMLQTGIAAVAILAVIATGADPLVVMFYDGTTAAGLGVMLLMACCCVAVIAYFARHGGGNPWRVFVAPAAGLAGLGTVIAVTITHYGTLIGVPNTSTTAHVLPALFAVPVVAGLAWAAIRRATNPDVYRLIGQPPAAFAAPPAATGRHAPTHEPVALGGEPA